jgi:TolA-binding protein
MTRWFNWLNLLGVGVLAVLCCQQWSANQRLSDSVAELHRTVQTQTAHIAEQDQQLKNAAADLDDLRQRLDISESARHADESKLTTLQSDRDRFAAQLGQTKKSLAAWTAACAARDAAIQQANTTISTLSARYVDAVTKYNDLVAKENHPAATRPTPP